MSGASQLRILVVDDEPHVCAAITRMLSSNCVVETLTSPMDALPLLGHTHFDVILVDYSMPELRGDGLVSIVRLRLPTQPIILMTGYPDMLECVNHPLPQVSAILHKPFRAGELREAIDRVLAARAIFSGTSPASAASATPTADSPLPSSLPNPP